jgi:type VI secretion system secreted protein VgrG
MKQFTLQRKRGLVKIAFTTGLLSLILAIALSLSAGATQAANLLAESPNLGAADSFSILAETTITNVPLSVISADVGLSPAAGSNIAGLTAAEVGGTIYTVSAGGPAGSVVNPTLLTTATSNKLSAYTYLSNLDCDYTYAGTQDLSILAQPLPLGVHCADAFHVSGTLDLTPGVIVFKSSETLTTATDSYVSSDDECNVWWRVGTNADLGVDSTFVGNILSGTHINLRTRATVVGGRLLAQSAVTLDQNTITGCAEPSIVPTATATAGPTATATAGPSPTAGPTAVPTAVPTEEPAPLLPDTGGDLAAGSGSQIIRFSLGALGLTLILVGFMLSRRTQTAER